MIKIVLFLLFIILIMLGFGMSRNVEKHVAFSNVRSELLYNKVTGDIIGEKTSHVK